ncbi:coiled-coil domain-containing protein 14 [Pelodytes ibericus]
MLTAGRVRHTKKVVIVTIETTDSRLPVARMPDFRPQLVSKGTHPAICQSYGSREWRDQWGELARTAVRKVSTTSVDSGYSLYSTDSEDQVLVINKGLDRCAALLEDILQNDVKDNMQQNPSLRATFPKGHGWPQATKVKKSIVRKPITASHVRKETGVSLRKSMPPVVHNSEKKTPCVNAQPRIVSPHTPVTQLALCEQIQTQMSRLMQDQRSECATLYNCRLPTSTPARSPQHSASPQKFCNEEYKQVVPQGGAAHFPSSMVTAAATQTDNQQTYQTDTLSQFLNNEKQIRESDLLQCVAAHLAQLQHTEYRQNLQNQIPGHPAAPSSEREEPRGETDEVSSGDDDDIVSEMVPVKDISCQTSFDKNPRLQKSSPEKKIKTVKYLLGEIKALMADQGDGEAIRLVTDLEHSVSLLPAVVGSTNMQAELALALQPLRSENAQLRRRVRILNQQLRDRERTEKASRSDEHYLEVISLQTMNMTLEHQLNESQKELESLQSKNEDFLKIIDAQKEENKKSAQIVQEKEQELHQIRQQSEMSATRAKIDVEALGKTKSLHLKLESAEKEKQIWEITLRQRDAEVSRLRELTRTLQGSMAKLLCDLSKESGKPKSGSNLTKSFLDSYDKQHQGDQCPASTSIISYLKKLETDQVFPSTSPIYPDNTPLANNAASKSYSECVTSVHSEDFKVQVGPDSYQKNGLRPGSIHNPEKHRTNTVSGSCISTYEDYRPDETTYLPLTSSPHKPQLVSSQRHMCTPPKAGIVSWQQETSSAYLKLSRSGIPEDPQIGGENKIRKTLPYSSETLDQSIKSGQGIPKVEPRPVTNSGAVTAAETNPPVVHQIKNVHVGDHNPPDCSMFDLMSNKTDWTLNSFSTFTSHDEQDFRNELAAFDANIAKLRRALQTGMTKQ